LEANNVAIIETVMASKKLQASDAKSLLKDANKLIAMKGKMVAEFDVKTSVGKDAVEAMLGPTGNMRAPAIRTGKTYLIGLNEEIFSDHFN
jgi:arsenate reductase-like glutaredoxin family protein